MVKINKKFVLNGFTLIELLVVISIVGFLASAAVYSLNITRMQSRDAKRRVDLMQIKKAMEMYYEDNKEYPPVSDTWNQIGAGGAIDTYLAPYLNPIPKDPLHDGSNYYYMYDPDFGCYTDSTRSVARSPNPAVLAAKNLETVTAVVDMGDCYRTDHELTIIMETD